MSSPCPFLPLRATPSVSLLFFALPQAAAGDGTPPEPGLVSGFQDGPGNLYNAAGLGEPTLLDTIKLLERHRENIWEEPDIPKTRPGLEGFG